MHQRLAPEGPQEVALVHFPALPWGISSEDDMLRILCFEYKARLSPFAKELLSLPCMRNDKGDLAVDTAAAQGSLERKCVCLPLEHLDQTSQLPLAELQAQRLLVNREECEPDVLLSDDTISPEA